MRRNRAATCRRGYSVACAIAFIVIFGGPVHGQWLDPTQRAINTASQHGQRPFPHDMDGGGLDVIAAWSLTDEVTVEFNSDGDGSSWHSVQVAANFVAMAALPIDANCDCVDDIVAVELFDRNLGFNNIGRVSWFERPPPPAPITTSPWTEHIIEQVYVHYRYLDVADIDGDDDDDVLLVSSGEGGGGEPGNVVVWYENRCTEGNDPRWAAHVVATSLNNPEGCALGLIDGDTSLDIVVVEYGGGRISWYASEGNPRRDNWTGRDIATGLVGPYFIRLYNADGDADPDILAAITDENRIAWFINPTDPTTDSWTTMNVVTDYPGPYGAALADFNNDGLLDIATGSFEVFPGDNLFSILENDGTGSYTRHDYPYFSFTFVDAADIDGDGDMDAVTTSYNGHRADWWENRHPLAPPGVESNSVVVR